MERSRSRRGRFRITALKSIHSTNDTPQHYVEYSKDMLSARINGLLDLGYERITITKEWY